MRDFTNLPDDLPMPRGELVKRPPAPRSASIPRTDAERIAHCRQLAKELGTPPGRVRHLRGDFAIDGEGRLSTSRRVSEPTPADLDMIRRDGGHAEAALREQEWDREGRHAEDEAIARLGEDVNYVLTAYWQAPSEVDPAAEGGDRTAFLGLHLGKTWVNTFHSKLDLSPPLRLEEFLEMVERNHRKEFENMAMTRPTIDGLIRKCYGG